MKPSWVYILLCSDESYYTGCTTNLIRRLGEHQPGFYHGYTNTRRPVKLVYSKQFNDIRYAIATERQIKAWSHGKKEALIRGDFNLLHKLAECKNGTHYKNYQGKKPELKEQ